MLQASKLGDPVLGIDIHMVLPPPPAPPTPFPMPHPFVGVVFDPIGAAVGAALGAVFGGGGPVLINLLPCGNTGTDVKGIPHFPMPPGVSFAPNDIPSNDGTLIFGSKTVTMAGSSIARLTDMVMTCNFPINLPTSMCLAVPMGAPVLVGGPPSMDIMAAVTKAIRTKWFSDAMHRFTGGRFSKVICFLTGHPVDVMTGEVLTDAVEAELPGPIPLTLERSYYSRSRYAGPLGVGWTHPLDASVSEGLGELILRLPDGRARELLPLAVGASHWDDIERHTLERTAKGYRLHTPDGLRYDFLKPSTARAPRAPTGSTPSRPTSTTPRTASRASSTAATTRSRCATPRGGSRRWSTAWGAASACAGRPTKPAGRGSSSTTPRWFGTRTTVRGGSRRRRTRRGRRCATRTGAASSRRRPTATGCRSTSSTTSRCRRAGARAPGVTAGSTTDGSPTTRRGTSPWWTTRAAAARTISATRSGWWSASSTRRASRPATRTTRAAARWRRPTGSGNAGSGPTTTAATAPSSATRSAGRRSGATTRSTSPRRSSTRGAAAGRSTTTGAASWSASSTPCGRSTATRTTPRASITEAIDPLGRRFTLRYERGVLAESTDWEGGTTRYGWDGIGHLVEHTDPMGRRARLQRDGCGRLLAVRRDDGTVLERRYDGEGNVTEEIDALGHVTRFRYAGMSRLVAQTDPSGGVVRYTYDTEDDLVGVTNEHGEVHTIERDRAGRVTREVGFDGRTLAFRYDRAGRCVETVSGAGRVTRIERDALGRVTKQKVPAVKGTPERPVPPPEETEYRYDGLGALVYTKNGDAEVALERDPLGRVVREVVNGRAVESGYDASGQRTSRRTSEGHTAEYHVDGNGLLRGVTVDVHDGWLRAGQDIARQTRARGG